MYLCCFLLNQRRHEITSLLRLSNACSLCTFFCFCFFFFLRKLLQTQMSLKNRPCSSFARFSAYRGRSRIEMSSFSLHWLQSFTRTLKKVTPLNNSFYHKKLNHQTLCFCTPGSLVRLLLCFLLQYTLTSKTSSARS